MDTMSTAVESKLNKLVAYSFTNHAASTAYLTRV